MRVSKYMFILFSASVLLGSCVQEDEEEPISEPDPRDAFIGNWTITNAHWYYTYDYGTDTFDSGTEYTEYPGSTISKGPNADELIISLSGSGGGTIVRIEDGSLFCYSGCLEDTYGPEADGWINLEAMEYYLGCYCGWESSSNTYTGVREP